MVSSKLNLKHSAARTVKKFLSELVEIPTTNPPGENYAEIISKIEIRMRELGIRTKTHEVVKGKPNLVATFGDGRPALLLTGHVDVVPAGSGWKSDPFKAVERGGKIYGRGTADMKGGLVAMMAAIRDLIDADVNLKGSLIFAATVDEETGGADGLGCLVRERVVQPDFCVVGEPTALKVAVCGKGVYWCKITVRGKAAHGSAPNSGINAIEEASKAILNLQSMKFRRKHELLGKPTINVGTVVGGTKINTVPDSCTFQVDRRTLPNESTLKVKGEIEQALRSLKTKNPRIKYNVEDVLDAKPFEIPRNSYLVKTSLWSAREVLGRGTRITGFQGVTDARFLSVEKKIPTVILGPGSMNEAHKPNEFVREKQLIEAVAVYATLAMKVLAQKAT